jgi:hypothetical protein
MVEIHDGEGNAFSFSFELWTRTSSVMKTMLLDDKMVESKTRIIKAEKFSSNTLKLFSVMAIGYVSKIMKQFKVCSLKDEMELLKFIHLYDFAIWKPVVERLICDKVKNQKDQVSVAKLFTFADLYGLEDVLLLCMQLRIKRLKS